MQSKVDIIRMYFHLLENFSTEATEFKRILHPEFIQREFPNILNKNGQESNLEEILKRTEIGKKMLSSQSYEINNTVESDHQLVVECVWRGQVRIDAGPLKAGQELKAYFCIVCDFKGNQIYSQKNYDCFEPFN